MRERPRKAHHPYSTKEDMVKRLNKIEGQIRGISKMIDQDIYCDDILTQFKSVEAAINGVRKTLLEAHIKGCVVNQIKNDRLDVVDELMVTINRMIK